MVLHKAHHNYDYIRHQAEIYEGYLNYLPY